MADRIVAVTVLLPGTPGTDRSARSTSQVTVAVTWAGVPTGAANPVVSTDTAVLAQVSPWLASVELAEADAAPSASALGAGDRRRAGRAVGGRLDGLVRDGHPAGEDDEPDEEQERGDADHGLDDGRAPLGAVPVRGGERGGGVGGGSSGDPLDGHRR